MTAASPLPQAPYKLFLSNHSLLEKMGQEASVPRNNGGADNGGGATMTTTTADHQAPPQGGRQQVVDGNNAAAAVVTTRVVSPSNLATTSVSMRDNPPGIIPYHHHPQSQQQPHQSSASASQQQQQLSPIAAPPSSQPQQQQAPQGGASSLRAGLSSMIQRMGGSSRGGALMGGGSAHGLSTSARSKKSAATAANHTNNSASHTSSPTSNGVHTPTRNSHSNSVHHNDLSPESKARKQALMLKRQQEEEQGKLQQQRQPLGTQQSSLSYYHTPSGTESSSTFVNMMYAEGHKSSTSSSSKTETTANLSTGHEQAAPIVQGMNNLSLSEQQQQNLKQPPQPPQQQQQQQQPKSRSPPSPRAQALKKMQNNDEEDWEKAWAEDSESDDDDEGDSSTRAEAGSARLPIVPTLEKTLTVGAGSSAAAKLAGMGPSALSPPAAALFRPEMDGGHSNASVQVRAPPTAAMHSAFTPTKPQPPGSFPNSNHHQQQQAYHHHQAMSTPSPVTIQTPIIQYPPIKNQSHFATPDMPSTQKEIDEDARLVREANAALQGGEGGQNHWDTYSRTMEQQQQQEEIVEEGERPCVDMFEPALRVLGRGSFGRVVLVQKRVGQSTGSLYAMKILRKSHLVRRRQIERTKTERKVLSVLDHPFIMKMYYAFQTTEKLYLVLDYCPGGELFFHLSRYRRFQEPVARFYAAELLLAIGHLHKNGIIYRDLKPENVLLDAYGHVKLGDFGLAKDGIRHPTQGAKSTCGTPEYMAPEVLNQGGHGFCVDYWGLGMILYEMMTGLPPWYTTDRSKLFRRLRSAPLIFPKEVHFSPHCRACIAGLLEREPRMRLGVMGLRSAMRHEFFYRRINFEALRARQIAAPIRPCEGWRQFQSRSNSMASGSDMLSASDHQPKFSGGGGGWHSAGPSLDSATMGGISAEALDVATANFDDSFRRMPIETEDYETQQQAAGHPPISENELNAQTFRGFTFDGDLPMEGHDEQHHYHHPAGRPSPGHPGSGGGGGL